MFDARKLSVGLESNPDSGSRDMVIVARVYEAINHIVSHIGISTKKFVSYTLVKHGISRIRSIILSKSRNHSIINRGPRNIT